MFFPLKTYNGSSSGNFHQEHQINEYSQRPIHAGVQLETFSNKSRKNAHKSRSLRAFLLIMVTSKNTLKHFVSLLKKFNTKPK